FEKTKPFGPGRSPRHKNVTRKAGRSQFAGEKTKPFLSMSGEGDRGREPFDAPRAKRSQSVLRKPGFAGKTEWNWPPMNADRMRQEADRCGAGVPRLRGLEKTKPFWRARPSEGKGCTIILPSRGRRI